MSALVELAPELYNAAAFAAFDPAVAAFSIGNARALMWFCQLAYETGQRPTIDAVAPRWGFTSVTSFVEPKNSIEASFDTCGLIGERPDAIVLAFAGTDPAVWQTVATDINVQRTPPPADTHKGFQAAFAAAQAEIEQAVDLSRLGNKPLFVTGHSLGAALAALAAQHASGLAGGTPRAVYTYGMPRTGGAQFRAAYNAALGDITYRLVHGEDVVPTVPPSEIGYHHVGRMLACASGAKFDATVPLAAADGDDPQFSPGLAQSLHNAVANAFQGNLFSPPGPGVVGLGFALLPQPIRDHLPDRYYGALA